MSLTVSYCCWLSLTVSPIPWTCCMSLTLSYVCLQSLTICLVKLSFNMPLPVSNSCCLFLTVSPIQWSCCMVLTVSNCYWLPLTVSPSAMELLYVSHCLLWLLAFCHSLSLCHKVPPCLKLYLMVAVSFSFSLWSNGVATCLSLSLPVPWSCCMSITVSHGCWRSLTFSPSPIELLHFSHCLL